MKYVRGFLMAWGMFCWIPCPYKQWRIEDRDAQIGMLPLLGAFLGAATCLIWWLMWLAGAGPLLGGAVIAGAYFLMTGFIHLDGFMDCSDAVMPRHPQMSERRRILKDSNTGAFGAICLVLMVMVFLGAWSELEEMPCLELFAAVIMILTLSRMVSAVSVLTCSPMQTSQYSKAWVKPGGGPVVSAIVTGTVFTAVAMWMSFAAVDGAVLIALVVSAAVTVITAVLVGIFDRSKLGGMNGDISGHMITTSEMCGLAALALMV